MISDSPDVKKAVFDLMNRNCDVSAWVLLLGALIVLCLVLLLFVTIINYKKLTAECNISRTQADTDALTGLWSRHAINRATGKGRGGCEAGSASFSVIFIDINGLKVVNDTYGHLVGDCVLKIFAQNLVSSIRSSDHAGRWGGDEFVVLASGLRSENDMEALCKKIEQATAKIITVENCQISISASFGYALAGVDGKNLKDLIRMADMRMYKNKYKLLR